MFWLWVMGEIFRSPETCYIGRMNWCLELNDVDAFIAGWRPQKHR